VSVHHFASTVCLLTAGLVLSFNAAMAQRLLVSAQEMQASNDAASSQFSAKSVPIQGAPSIVIISPTLPGAVKSPATIELQFEAVAPSAVKPQTFKALYGTFGIDITERLLALASVSASGVKVQEAALPKGNHKILLTIDDTDGRRGSRTIEFEVH
jgi:hypothetical protein